VGPDSAVGAQLVLGLNIRALRTDHRNSLSEAEFRKHFQIPRFTKTPGNCSGGSENAQAAQGANVFIEDSTCIITLISPALPPPIIYSPSASSPSHLCTAPG
jgi:hypothetical protein